MQKQLIKQYKDFALYKYANKIYLIEATCKTTLGMLFLRCQEFYDSRIKDIDLINFIYNYCKTHKNVFDYCKIFIGYNLPSKEIEKVYKRDFARNKLDNLMLDVYNRIDDKNYYLIGLYKPFFIARSLAFWIMYITGVATNNSG